MSNPLKALGRIFNRNSTKKVYEGRGEEFKYWEKYMMQEKAKVRGPEIWRTLVGYKKKNILNWYYDEDRPNTTASQMKQSRRPVMPPVKPIKNWDIFLGDKVEILVGKDKGKVGEVVEIVKERNWCFVEGLHLEYKDIGGNKYKSYLRDMPQHIAVEKPLLVTHEVKLVDPSDLRATDFEWRYTERGEQVRVSVRTGRIIPIPHRHKHTWVDFTRAWEYKPSKKDTTSSNLQTETFKPKLSTFEKDVAESLGIEYSERRKTQGYWY